ncbi:MAG: glycosyltransferase [Candidatus Rokubacteria bacterium]|nr:glycosyltransferase [Candidatus Rokubacteria bacterium]
MPRVTVLMSVYNGARWLREALDSVLGQTYRDFEFVIVDDGSTDDSAAILASVRDPRITLVRQPNQGLAAALNRGLREARGELVARQDQDDVSLPERLARQVAAMDAQPRTGLLGTQAETIDAEGRACFVRRYPTDSLVLKWQVMFDNPFVHSSVMLRRAALDDVGGYSTDPRRQPPEDYELWLRLVSRWDVGNLPEVLLRYREAAGSMMRSGERPFAATARALSLEALRRVAGGALPDARLLRVLDFVNRAGPPAGAVELAGVVRDLGTLERAFCRHYGLGVRAALGLKLRNRRRLAHRALAMARGVVR